MTPDCSECAEPAIPAGRADPQWWACPSESCGIIAFIDDDASLADDPRNPQTAIIGRWDR